MMDTLCPASATLPINSREHDGPGQSLPPDPHRREGPDEDGGQNPLGVFYFKRLAIGLSSSAQSFQRLLDHVLDGLFCHVLEGVFCYLGDIMVYTKDEASRKQVVEGVFKRLEGVGLAIASSLEYLPGEGSAKARSAAEILMPLYTLGTCQIEKKTKFLDIRKNSPKIRKAYSDSKK